MKKWVIASISSVGATSVVATSLSLGLYYGAIDPLQKAIEGFIPPNKSFRISQTGKINLLALGDSVTSGHSTYKGVDATSYGDFVAGYLNSKNRLGTYDNEAVSGYKTRDLKVMLATNADVRNKVAKADLINLSIGANDLIEVLKIINKTQNKYSLVNFHDFLDGINSNFATDGGESTIDSSQIYQYRTKKTSQTQTETTKANKSALEVLFQLINNVYAKGDSDSYINQIFSFDYKALKSKLTDILHNILAIQKLIAEIQADPKLGNDEHQAQVIFLGYEFPFTSFLNQHDPTSIKINDKDVDGDGDIDADDQINLSADLAPLGIWKQFMKQLQATTNKFQARNKNHDYYVQFLDINQIPGFKWNDFKTWDQKLYQKKLFQYMPNTLDIHPSIAGHRAIAQSLIEKFAPSWGIKTVLSEFDNKGGLAVASDNLALNNHLPYTIKDNNDKKIELFELQNGTAKEDLWASDLLKSLIKTSRGLNPQDSFVERRFQLVKAMSKTFWSNDQASIQRILGQLFASFVPHKSSTSWEKISDWRKSSLSDQRSALDKFAPYAFDITTFLLAGTETMTIAQFEAIINHLRTQVPQFAPMIDYLKTKVIANLKDIYETATGTTITSATKVREFATQIQKLNLSAVIHNLNLTQIIASPQTMPILKSVLKIFDSTIVPLDAQVDYYNYSDLYQEIKAMFASFGGATLIEQLANIDLLKVLQHLKTFDLKRLANTPHNSFIYQTIDSLQKLATTTSNFLNLNEAKKLFSSDLFEYIGLVYVLNKSWSQQAFNLINKQLFAKLNSGFKDWSALKNYKVVDPITKLVDQDVTKIAVDNLKKGVDRLMHKEGVKLLKTIFSLNLKKLMQDPTHIFTYLFAELAKVNSVFSVFKPFEAQFNALIPKNTKAITQQILQVVFDVLLGFEKSQ